MRVVFRPGGQIADLDLRLGRMSVLAAAQPLVGLVETATLAVELVVNGDAWEAPLSA